MNRHKKCQPVRSNLQTKSHKIVDRSYNSNNYQSRLCEINFFSRQNCVYHSSNINNSNILSWTTELKHALARHCLLHEAPRGLRFIDDKKPTRSSYQPIFNKNDFIAYLRRFAILYNEDKKLNISWTSLFLPKTFQVTLKSQFCTCVRSLGVKQHFKPHLYRFLNFWKQFWSSQYLV